MRKFLATCLMVGMSGTVLAVDLEPKVIRDFTPGLVTNQDATLLPDGAAQDLQNVDIDDGSIRKRLGTIKVNSSTIGSNFPIRFLQEYVDPTNSFWLLAVSSSTLYGSTDGGASFSVLQSGGGISPTSQFQAAVAFGSVYLVDGSATTITFDGATVSTNSFAPIGGAVAFYAGRLWIASGSTIYGCRVSDPNDWTDDGVDDADAFSAVVRNNDGYGITVMRPFGQDLMIFKAKSIDRLSVNSDGLTFSLIPVTSHLGTTHPDSVVAVDNAIVWLAQDGYYAYDGSQIKRISEAVTPTIKQITALDALTRSFTETEMTAGSYVGTSASRVSGQVMINEVAQTDTSAGDFSAGSLSGLSTTIINGAVALDPVSTSIANRSFELGVVADNWTTTGSGTAIVNSVDETDLVAPYPDGVRALRITGGSSPFVYVFDGNGGVLWQASLLDIATGSPAPWYSRTIPVSSWAYKYISVAFGHDLGKITSDSFYAAPTIMSYYGAHYEPVITARRVGIDALSGGKLAVTTGSFTSRVFDTGMVSPVWRASIVDYTPNGNSVSFFTESSADSLSWDPPVPLTPNGIPASASKRYIRYSFSISLSTTSTGAPFVSDVTLAAGLNSGRYVSPSIDTSGATAWGQFTVVDDRDSPGTILYTLYTDTDTVTDVTNPATYVSSESLVSGQTPSLAISSHSVLRADFSAASGHYNQYLSSWQLQWSEGTSTIIVSSEFHDQKYYSSVSLGGVHNDTLLVYDKNGSWTKYTGLTPFFMKKYRTFLLFGDALSGNVVRMNEVGRYRDWNDSPIDAYWVSKDFDLGAPITTKSLLRYYLTGNRVVNGNITFTYGVERGSLVGASYDLDQYPGFFRKSIVPSSTTYSEGIQHRFKISDSTLDGDMSVLSVTGQWRLNTNP